MQQGRITFWVFLAPVLIAFTMVVIVPFVLGFFFSLTDWDGIKMSVFLGLDNYWHVFMEDPRFFYSISITLVYSVLNIVTINICALALALLLTQKLALQKLFRAGFLIPNLISGLVVGYIWQFIFNRLVTDLMQGNDFLMLADRDTAILALVIVGNWEYVGYLMVIYITALQSIPKAMLEAAMIDGASAWQRFKNVTIPMIAPAFTITTFLTLLYSLKQYDVNYSLTFGGPSTMFLGKAINGTELISMNILNESNQVIGGKSQMAVAQAKAVIFFFALLFVSLVQVHVNKKKELEM